MSGYLQRLVQTAAQPVQTVHPVAGSIFAPSRDNPLRGFESEEFVIAAPRSTVPTGATSQQQNVPGHDPRRDTAPRPEFRAIAPVSAATPLLSKGDSDALPPWPEQSVQPLRPAANVRANDTGQPAANVEADHTEQPHVPVFRRAEFHPLMPREVVVAETPLAHAPFRAEIRAPHLSRRPAAVERASDDTQIHIGRIEVTAVHPPAPRRDKTPDRTPSLDTYLNRRAR